MAIIIAINEVNIVILKGTQKEYLLLVAAKSPWNKIFANPKAWNPLIAYEKIKITKVYDLSEYASMSLWNSLCNIININIFKGIFINHFILLLNILI